MVVARGCWQEVRGVGGLLPATYEPSRVPRGTPTVRTLYVSMDEDLAKTNKEILEKTGKDE